MLVHVVSDVHGNADALARAADGAEALLVLGDLLDFVDYDEPTLGILAEILGPDATVEFARLRAEGGPGALGEYSRKLWADVDDPRALVDAAVHRRYEQMFAVLGGLDVPVWLIPGNVDVPAMWPEFLAAYPRVRAVDGEVVEIGEHRVGFVGGVPLPAGRQPRAGVFRAYMREAGEYAAAVEALGAVDVALQPRPTRRRRTGLRRRRPHPRTDLAGLAGAHPSAPSPARALRPRPRAAHGACPDRSHRVRATWGTSAGGGPPHGRPLVTARVQPM